MVHMHGAGTHTCMVVPSCSMKRKHGNRAGKIVSLSVLSNIGNTNGVLLTRSGCPIRSINGDDQHVIP